MIIGLFMRVSRRLRWNPEEEFVWRLPWGSSGSGSRSSGIEFPELRDQVNPGVGTRAAAGCLPRGILRLARRISLASRGEGESVGKADGSGVHGFQDALVLLGSGKSLPRRWSKSALFVDRERKGPVWIDTEAQIWPRMDDLPPVHSKPLALGGDFEGGCNTLAYRPLES